MSDRNATGRVSLGDALRAMPPATPPRDGWARLAAGLAPVANAPRRRWIVPLSLAAAAVIAFAVVTTLAPQQAHVSTPLVATAVQPRASIATHSTQASTNRNAEPTGQPVQTQLARLQARSQSLEHWLRKTRDAGSPLQGQDLVAATEIENLIALVDVELTVPEQTHAAALWRRRVGLLEDLAVLRYSNYQLAAGDMRLASRSRID